MFLGGKHRSEPDGSSQSRLQTRCLTDAYGLLLVVRTTPANVQRRRDDHVAVRKHAANSRPQMTPRSNPDVVQRDAGYCSAATRKPVKAQAIKLLWAPLANACSHGSGHGKIRYAVDRTLNWFGNFRRLKLCLSEDRIQFSCLSRLGGFVNLPQADRVSVLKQLLSSNWSSACRQAAIRC